MEGINFYNNLVKKLVPKQALDNHGNYTFVGWNKKGEDYIIGYIIFGGRGVIFRAPVLFHLL